VETEARRNDVEKVSARLALHERDSASGGNGTGEGAGGSALERDRKELAEADAALAYALTEFHRRLSLSLCALTFPLAAFVLGMFVTSANRLLPFFLGSTVVPGVYFSFELLGNNLARRGVYPWVSEHLGNLLLTFLCLGLLFKNSRAPKG
jgi:lipopolysaccharide export LptBFGC system permease protein LptF